jgi:quercetin dioxygenase-like cupin family protein
VNQSDERLRPHPSTRLAGPVVPLNLPEHRAPGHVVIHCLRGELTVEAGAAHHRLGAGEAIVLDPDVPHAVEAVAESEMLLTVCVG